MKNRLPVTVRFSISEQQELRNLMEFYGCTDPKVLLQLAYNQFKTATKELQRRLAAEKEKKNASDSTDSRSDGNSPRPSADVQVVGSDSNGGSAVNSDAVD